MVSNLLSHLNMYGFVRLDEIHPKTLKEFVEVLDKSFSIIYQQSWLTRKVPVKW